MKYLITILLFFFSSSILFSQEYKRNVNETAFDFANRIKPEQGTNLIELEERNIIETTLSNTPNKVIFTFYKNFSGGKMIVSDAYIMGFAYVEVSDNSYQKIIIDYYELLDNEFSLENAYFIDNDNDKEKELVIKYYQSSSETSILITKLYDNFDYINTSNKLTELSGFRRFENETALDFVTRILPNSIKITDKIIETSLWDKKTNTIIVFYKSSIINKFKKYPYWGQVFVESEKNIYKSTIIDKTADSSLDGYAIESVFFVNADKDAEKELAVMYSSLLKIDEKSEGKSSWTYIYDNVNFNSPQYQLIRLNKFDAIFREFVAKLKSGSYENAKYKTASDVKQKLKEMRH